MHYGYPDLESEPAATDAAHCSANGLTDELARGLVPRKRQHQALLLVAEDREVTEEAAPDPLPAITRNRIVQQITDPAHRKADYPEASSP